MKKEISANNPWNAMIDSFNTALSENSDVLPVLMKNTGESIAKATLKKVYDKSGNINIMHMRNSLQVDIAQIDNASNDDFKLLPLSDSYDLVNDGIQSLLESHASGQDVTENGSIDIEHRITRHTLSRKVWIDKELAGSIDKDSLEAMYRDYESSPIQDSYRHVRKCIDSRGSIKIDPKSKYSYIKEEIEDTAIYHRLPRYCQYLDVDITGSVSGHTTVTPTMPNTDTLTCLTGDYSFTKDSKGRVKIIAKTVDYSMDNFWNDISSELNLTDKEAKIVKYRFNGLGYGRIASLLNITESMVRRDIDRIKDKANMVDLFNLYLASHGYNMDDIENRDRLEQAETNYRLAVRKVEKMVKAVEQSEQKLNNGLIKADSHKRTIRRYNSAIEAKDKAEKQLAMINNPCPNCKRVNGINWHTYKRNSHKVKTITKPYMALTHKPKAFTCLYTQKSGILCLYRKPVRFSLFERQLERQTEQTVQAEQDRTKQADRIANYENCLLPIDYDNYELPKLNHAKATEKNLYSWLYILPFMPLDKADKAEQADKTVTFDWTYINNYINSNKSVTVTFDWTYILPWLVYESEKPYVIPDCPIEIKKSYWYINAKNLASRMVYMDRKKQADRQVAIANLTVKKWMSKHDCNTMTNIGFDRICKYADRHNITF